VEARSTLDSEDRELVAIIESNLGLCGLFLDERDEAAARFRSALETAPPGARLVRAEAMLGIAALATAAPKTAVHLWSSGRSILEDVGSPLGQVLERVERVFLERLRAALARNVFARLWDEGKALTMSAAAEVAEDLARGLGEPERDAPGAGAASLAPTS